MNAERRMQNAELRIRSQFSILHSAFCIHIVLLFAACATTQAPPSISPPADDHAIWFVLAEDDDGRVIAAHNAGKRYMTASNRKVFAAATIATCLGLDTRLTTEIWRDGDDLVIVGDGDPSLGSWRYERSEDFNRIAEQLLAR